MKSTTTGDKKARTHELILDTAAKAIRRGGYAGVSVAELMKEAGLTHGGFYAHFASRNAMLAEAMARASELSSKALTPAVHRAVAEGKSPLRALVENYLRDAHLEAVEHGCPIAALGSEICRQPQEVRAVALQQIDSLRSAIAQALPAQANKDSADAIMATLVGSLQLARAYGNNDAGRQLLAASRRAVLAQYDPAQCEQVQYSNTKQ
ncbi:AcrR family transcriptional regulator [Rheinheimera pacifica]|uniref:TetR/AcrR family transcriptional regulator n=1 Tax=Rheinheimera pacifica TaxID=173990 RepID=UPI002855E841|nr:TetR/AcrR family transcriptional regulator [Rheinheimera pacifica]MDR6981788.1 AcrR family transcriptional regulator [Rheinheimera pacifica]